MHSAGLINQHHILVPTTTINTNDGSIHTETIKNNIKPPVHSFSNDIYIIGAGSIIILYLICKK